MSYRPRDYSHPEEIHMEPAELHEPTNTVPPYPSALENALERVARQNLTALGGTEYQIAMRRIQRENDTCFAHPRYPTHTENTVYES